MVKILGLKADEKGLRLTHEIDDDVHQYLRGDKTRLRQILLNLVNNAIKFTLKGQVGITVKNAKCKVRSNNYSPLLTLNFEISDTGVGIPQDRIERLFKAFSQADSSTTRRFGGTGLGLSISKKLVEMMGGEIGVESEEGKGSTFWFTAEFEKSGERRVESEVCEKKTINTDNSALITHNSQLSLLLVEDNIYNQKVASAILRKFGLSADIANNGKEAVELIVKKSYNLILMDIEMPEMDGIEATEIIRKSDSENRNVPIIAMTAHAMKGNRERYLEAGMNDYIAKPVDPHELLAAILRNTGDSFIRDNVGANNYLPLQPQTAVDSRSVLDRKDFLKRLGGNEEALKGLLNDLPPYLSEAFGKLQAAVKNNNINDIRLYAHNLKGLAANVSAYRLRDAAAEIGTALKQGLTDDLDLLMKKSEYELERLLQVLNH